MGVDTDIAGKVKKMFDGEHINNTEDREVWHVKLRSNESECETVK